MVAVVHKKRNGGLAVDGDSTEGTILAMEFLSLSLKLMFDL